MISHILQNLTAQDRHAHPQVCSGQCFPQVGGDGLIKRALIGLKAKAIAVWERQLLEAEYRDAVKHLYAMTDEQLRDMGITRMDIHQVVRHGKS